MKTHTIIETALGRLTLVNRDDKLAGIYMENHTHQPDPATFGERTAGNPTKHDFEQAETQLNEYFAGTRQTFDLETDPEGNPFQHRVWALLRQIPYGETRTYGELADELGDRKLARAVGSAGARNPLSVVVPCHRVISSTGALTGYAGGLARKQWLLDLEAQ